MMKKAKKEKNNNSKNTVMNGNELKSLIILVVIVSLIFLAFYGITLLVDKKENKGETGVLQETIQYDEIMVGQILNRKEKDYYVLIKNSDNNYNNLYLAYLNTYVTNNEEAKYYTVDFGNALNSSYVGETTIIDKNNFFDSKFADTTLIRVKNNKISKVYSTHEDIFTLLKQIAA